MKDALTIWQRCLLCVSSLPSSVKKYQAMQNSVCADNHVRGMFSSTEPTVPGGLPRLVQLQIYPRTICLTWLKREVW